MAVRGKCSVCGKRVAIDRNGRIKGHGQGSISRDYAGGMVCTGAGKGPVGATKDQP